MPAAEVTMLPPLGPVTETVPVRSNARSAASKLPAFPAPAPPPPAPEPPPPDLSAPELAIWGRRGSSWQRAAHLNQRHAASRPGSHPLLTAALGAEAEAALKLALSQPGAALAVKAAKGTASSIPLHRRVGTGSPAAAFSEPAAR